jgi:hypothetical protein
MSLRRLKLSIYEVVAPRDEEEKELCICSPYMPPWRGQGQLYLYLFNRGAQKQFLNSKTQQSVTKFPTLKQENYSNHT